MKYEKDYQELAHNHLCTDEDYYVMRANFAYKDYFQDKFLRSKKFLEYGVGMGQNIYALNAKGYDVSGYDISKFALDFCKKKGLNVTCKLNKKDKYDVIFCRHVLEHLNTPYDTLKEMVKHLNTDGYLDLIVPYERHKNVPFGPDRNGHLWAWNFRCLNNLLHELGLKVIHNEVLVEGDGYQKLRSYHLCKFVGWIRGCRELRVVACKQ